MAARPLIDATDLAQWSLRRHAQENLPRLLRRLVHCTATGVERLGFPSGEGIQLGGFDGVVVVAEGNEFVPGGTSVWELGTGRELRAKADADFEKRCRDPLCVDPATTTFVFVTPRRWRDKQKWAAGQRKRGLWHDVRAYDADDLEQWLELAPSVHVWISVLLGSRPEGMLDLATVWANWAAVTRPALSPQLVTSGRSQDVERLYTWLRGEEAVLNLEAPSREEALAFFCAAVLQLPTDEATDVMARAVAADDPASWQHLVASEWPLILIPRFETRETSPLAATAGHRVLIAYGNGEVTSGLAISLPRLRRVEAQDALLAMGISERRATELAIVARRSLTALRRSLAIAPDVERPRWAQPADARALLPALVAGGWNDAAVGDREALAKLGQRPYEEINAALVRWAHESDPPVRRIGSTWLLVSRADAWPLLATYLSANDLRAFQQTAIKVLGAIDPQFDLPPDQRWYASILGKAAAYSSLLREGLADTLALMAARSDSTQLADAASGASVAASIVRSLLEAAAPDWRAWASLDRVLPLLAEASPTEFLAVADAASRGDDPTLPKLFIDSQDPLFRGAMQTGLLWALETLAWSVDYLSPAALLLARLARLDPNPGSNYANRPHASLRDIFLWWAPQTAASVTQRLRVLDLLREREPHVAWILLCSLLPHAQGYTSGTHEPRWEEWVPDPKPTVTWANIWHGAAEVITRLVQDVGSDAQRWKNLIEEVQGLPREVAEPVVLRLNKADVTEFADSDRAIIRDALRGVISKHRAFAESDWALSSERVAQLQHVYDRFEPSDALLGIAWLFAKSPKLIDPPGHDWRATEERLGDLRRSAVESVYAEGGLARLRALATMVEQPGVLGFYMGETSAFTDEQDLLTSGLAAADQTIGTLARSFVTGRFRVRGRTWSDDTLRQLAADGWSPEQKAKFLTCLPSDNATWDAVDDSDPDVQRLYWTNAGIWWLPEGFDCVRAVEKLCEHGRPYSAVFLIGACFHSNQGNVPALLIANTLEQVVRTKPEAGVDWSMLAYHMGDLLDILETAPDIEAGRIASLEWAFLPLLEHNRPPRALHMELARNPDFFVQVLTYVYGNRADPERKQTPDDEARARLASELLRSWHAVPSLLPDGCLDAAALGSWVKAVRERAVASVVGEAVDRCIGQILSFAPKDADGSWPDIAVRNLIEQVESADLERGLEIQIYNNRGVVTKSLLDGGNQERQIENSYRNDAAQLADRWPRTSAILRRVSRRYGDEARREDHEAELHEDIW